MVTTLSHERRTWAPAYLVVTQVLTTLLLGIRLLSRFQWRGGRLGLDDLFITIGWALGTAGTGVAIEAALHYGYDQHIWDVPLHEAVGAIEYAYIITLIYVASTSFTKLSILLFYRRLVQGTYTPRFKWAIWVAIAVVVSYTIIMAALIIFTCLPIEATWMRYDLNWVTTNKYKCASNRQVLVASLASGILSVLTDFYTVVLPGWLFLKIKISRRQRIAMMSIFSIGILVVVAGIVRTFYLYKAEGPDIDKTWNTFNAVIAGKTEGDFGIICACAPSLKSYFRHYFKDRMTTIGGSANKSRATQNSHTASLDTHHSEQELRRSMKDPWTEKSVIESEDLEMDHARRAQNLKATYAENLKRGRNPRRPSSGQIIVTHELSQTYLRTSTENHSTEDLPIQQPTIVLDGASDDGRDHMEAPAPAYDRRTSPLRAHPPASWLYIESSGESGDEARPTRLKSLARR